MDLVENAVRRLDYAAHVVQAYAFCRAYRASCGELHVLSFRSLLLLGCSFQAAVSSVTAADWQGSRPLEVGDHRRVIR